MKKYEKPSRRKTDLAGTRFRTCYEDAVSRYLKQRVESLAMNDKIFNIIVPKEKSIKIKAGKRTTTEEKIYPGYVLVEMIMEPDSWYVVRNTPRVTGFAGSDSTSPTPLSYEEVESLKARMSGDEPKFKVDFRIGEMVRITDGPFKDYDKISEVDESRGRVKVLVRFSAGILPWSWTHCKSKIKYNNSLWQLRK